MGTEIMEDKSIISQLQYELPVGGTEIHSFEELREKWALYFNNLIQNDFPKLVGLLYRIDLSEQKLRHLLKENRGEDAGNLITSLVIERLLQKIKFRQEFRAKPDGFTGDPDGEKW
jgi:hypothetical protein